MVIDRPEERVDKTTKKYSLVAPYLKSGSLLLDNLKGKIKKSTHRML